MGRDPWAGPAHHGRDVLSLEIPLRAGYVHAPGERLQGVLPDYSLIQEMHQLGTRTLFTGRPAPARQLFESGQIPGTFHLRLQKGRGLPKIYDPPEIHRTLL